MSRTSTAMQEKKNLRKVVGYDFHLLRKKCDVQSMWGDLAPQWRLLKSQLETKGPGWYSPAEREERLFTNKSNRPGDDIFFSLHCRTSARLGRSTTGVTCD